MIAQLTINERQFAMVMLIALAIAGLVPGDGSAHRSFCLGFGTRHFGSLTGLVTLVHHMSGAVGAYLGSAAFDSTGSFNIEVAH
jgi:hypothetical protein